VRPNPLRSTVTSKPLPADHAVLLRHLEAARQSCSAEDWEKWTDRGRAMSLGEGAVLAKEQFSDRATAGSMVGGRGHYLNSRIDLESGILGLLRTNRNPFEQAAEGV